VSTRVLIADDQALVRAGFRKLLESAPGIEVVGEAADGEQAVEEARRLRPTLVLMDIRMPRLDGIEATRRLTADDRDATRVLILTTFGLDHYVYDALRAGASGFMLKDAPPEELLAAIEVIARGDALIAPAVTRSVIEEFTRRSPAPTPPPPVLDELTAREREVLELLARGLSNAEIAARLVVSDGTVKTHVAHVLSKLSLRDRVQAVILAYECGVVRPGHQA
jgi:DNA-binding NarL/FixJ family response regulator